MNKRHLVQLEEMVKKRIKYRNPLVDLLIDLSGCIGRECSHEYLRTLTTPELLKMTEETMRYAVQGDETDK